VSSLKFIDRYNYYNRLLKRPLKKIIYCFVGRVRKMITLYSLRDTSE